MANQDVVWFRNRQTGAETAVVKGSAHQRRLLTTVTDDDEPEPVWEQIQAPKAASTKYRSGQSTPVVHTVKRPLGKTPAKAPAKTPADPGKTPADPGGGE